MYKLLQWAAKQDNFHITMLMMMMMWMAVANGARRRMEIVQPAHKQQKESRWQLN
jgi:hypothetical protein